jgi:hypothetical protein
MYWTWVSHVPSSVENAGDVGVALGSALASGSGAGRRRWWRPSGSGLGDGVAVGTGASDGSGVALFAGGGVFEGGFGVPFGTGGGGGACASTGACPDPNASASARAPAIPKGTMREKREDK